MLTVYGIETAVIPPLIPPTYSCNSAYRLRYWNSIIIPITAGATVKLQQCLPFTVLKPDILNSNRPYFCSCNSAYRLRYWNIPTTVIIIVVARPLQQCLPFTVLKLTHNQCRSITCSIFIKLQQCLPFTVLKLKYISAFANDSFWLQQYLPFTVLKPLKLISDRSQSDRCNSTYCLQYWNGISFKVTSCFIKCGCKSI